MAVLKAGRQKTLCRPAAAAAPPSPYSPNGPAISIQVWVHLSRWRTHLCRDQCHRLTAKPAHKQSKGHCCPQLTQDRPFRKLRRTARRAAPIRESLMQDKTIRDLFTQRCTGWVQSHYDLSFCSGLRRRPLRSGIWELRSVVEDNRFGGTHPNMASQPLRTLPTACHCSRDTI
jgi:hypothetical protein